MSENDNLDPFPQMGDGDGKDVKTHDKHLSIPPLGGFDFSQYQSANRVYNVHGLLYFFFLMIGYSVVHMLGDNLAAYDQIGLLLRSLGLSLLMPILYVLCYLLVDTYLFKNPVDLRYSISKYATYGLWTLVFGGIFVVVFFAAFLVNSFGMSSQTVSLANFLMNSRMLLQLMDLWLMLVPAFIFLFQRGAELRARIVGLIGYGLIVGLLFLIGLVGGHISPKTDTVIMDNNNQPYFQVVDAKSFQADQNDSKMLLNKVLTTPFNVKLTDPDDKKDNQLALAYAQHYVKYTKVVPAMLKMYLSHNGFDSKAITYALSQVHPQ